MGCDTPVPFVGPCARARGARHRSARRSARCPPRIACQVYGSRGVATGASGGYGAAAHARAAVPRARGRARSQARRRVPAGWLGLVCRLGLSGCGVSSSVTIVLGLGAPGDFARWICLFVCLLAGFGAALLSGRTPSAHGARRPCCSPPRLRALDWRCSRGCDENEPISRGRPRMSPREHDEIRRAAAVRGVRLRLWEGHHLAQHGQARQGKPRAAHATGSSRASRVGCQCRPGHWQLARVQAQGNGEAPLHSLVARRVHLQGAPSPARSLSRRTVTGPGCAEPARSLWQSCSDSEQMRSASRAWCQWPRAWHRPCHCASGGAGPSSSTGHVRSAKP